MALCSSEYSFSIGNWSSQISQKPWATSHFISWLTISFYALDFIHKTTEQHKTQADPSQFYYSSFTNWTFTLGEWVKLREETCESSWAEEGGPTCQERNLTAVHRWGRWLLAEGNKYSSGMCLFICWRVESSKWVALKVRGRTAGDPAQGVTPTPSRESSLSAVWSFYGTLSWCRMRISTSPTWLTHAVITASAKTL